MATAREGRPVNMMRDLRTVIWKEWRGTLRGHGSRMRAVLTLMVPVAWFGLAMPWQAGTEYVRRLDPFFAAFAIPLLVGILIVPDSFAGERERHTLPTLLASRLPDAAILYGKALYVIGLAWGATLLVLSIGLTTVNILHWNGNLLVFQPRIALGCFGLGAIASTIPVGAGILISLRSPTVQVAQQTLTAVLLLPPTILGPILLVFAETRPKWPPLEALANLGLARLALLVFGILAALDVVLFVLASKRFRRSKLV